MDREVVYSAEGGEVDRIDADVTDETGEISLESDGDVDGGEAGRSRRLWVALVALGLVIALVLWFFAGRGEDAADQVDTGGDVQTVSVFQPGSRSVTREITASGTLSARRRTPVGVVGEGGRVVAVLADEGDWVKAGQVLVRIDQSVQTQQVEAARAQVDVARADLELAQNELDRALALVDRGFISKADVDRKRATRDSARARVRAAEASVNELRARAARLNIYAPASGIILERNVEVGQVVTGGATALFELAEGGQMELAAELSEQDLSEVAVGTPAIVQPVGTEGRIEGRVWQIAPTIDPGSRLGTARIAVPYAEQIRPGGFANAVIRAGAVSAPLLPESAVLNDDDGDYVYIVGSDNRVRRRDVTTGLVTSAGVTISTGLDGNERVVLRSGAFLNPGEEVNPQLVRSLGGSD